MPSLERKLRRDLENTVKAARRKAEEGAAKALEQLAVERHEPHASMTPAQRTLRNRLRAHGRQLGDHRDKDRGTQSIARLTQECAYEHWHRMLFARFLAENELLIEPDSGMAISLEECVELSREQGVEWLQLASAYAVKMLLQIFRKDDPVLEVPLPRETRSDLEDLLQKLPPEVFRASDSLGWCYQFWQSERKEEVNASGNKIGADELPAVTQLFTEDYMVDFLLDNTLGAWHAGKVLAANPTLAETAQSEDELRQAVAMPGCPWKYLRFIQDKDGNWTPAAGTFDGWPKTAKELTCLDPCMGSGHFVVAMFERLVALRLAEEKLDESAAVAAVIRDNLFGLEIDPRCTQIGAFNLALAAWRRVGHCPLPAMNLACSGLAPNAKLDDWLVLAGDNEPLQRGMANLYALFQDAPVLGSLINPRAGEGDLLVAGFHKLQPLLEQALAQESADDTAHETVVTARGLAKAAEILAGQFTLVATNVPYLGSGKQDDVLRDYCERVHLDAKADLASSFVDRGLSFCAPGSTAAFLTPQNWLYLGPYKKVRARLLRTAEWNFVMWLGAKAFQTPMWDFNVVLVGLTQGVPIKKQEIAACDVSDEPTPTQKSSELPSQVVRFLAQFRQLENPDSRVLFAETSNVDPLGNYAESFKGLATGDLARFIFSFWEVAAVNNGWRCLQGSVGNSTAYAGKEQIILWEDGRGQLFKYVAERLGETGTGAWLRGEPAWGHHGVAVAQISSLKATLFAGDLFDESTAAIIPKNPHNLTALWAYCSSGKFSQEVRKLDDSMKVPTLTLLKVPFDLAHWQKVAAEKYPNGLPKPFSSDPTQWLFNGQPAVADQPLHVAVARLLGYQWPRQTGSSFPDCPTLESDGLEKFADTDGIVCLNPVHGESPAAQRVMELLATAYGADWSAAKLNELLAACGGRSKTLDDWLRDAFFEQHSALFHHRPFIWHLWDGLRDGFHAMVNYHRLAGPDGEGKRTLEKLIYTYLGDWITRQRNAQAQGEEGADARLAAALHLQAELKKILEGEPPYDIFVRWKPLHEQAIGWDPDINDGVRLNIRPFLQARPLNARARDACILRTTPKNIKWTKDRGKEPQRDKADYPWFWGWDEKTPDFPGKKTFDGNRWNDLHYTHATKQAARERRGQG
jgi:hypothetical protein